MDLIHLRVKLLFDQLLPRLKSLLTVVRFHLILVSCLYLIFLSSATRHEYRVSCIIKKSTEYFPHTFLLSSYFPLKNIQIFKIYRYSISEVGTFSNSKK